MNAPAAHRLSPLSLHRRRGEVRGEGFGAAAQVAAPLIRPAATFSPRCAKGEGLLRTRALLISAPRPANTDVCHTAPAPDLCKNSLSFAHLVKRLARISIQNTMTLKEYLKLDHPDIETVKVTITEYCDFWHPPESTEWDYSESADADTKVHGRLRHDESSTKTAHFSLADPILKTISRGLERHSGKLTPYFCDDGAAVTRRFKCEIAYKRVTAAS